jgi:hypothetical protein
MRRALLVMVALLWAGTASAQSLVYNPRYIDFESPNHTTACPADACVSSYIVEYWLAGVDPATGAPFMTMTLAKDKVVSSGGLPIYRAAMADLTPVPVIPVGQTYVVRMVAVGATPELKSARSDPSNSFAAAGAPQKVGAVTVR